MRSNGKLVGTILMATTTALGVITGCRHRPPPPPPERRVATTDAVRSLRAAYQQSDPGARVGLVIISRPDLGNLVAVGDVSVQDFREGDPITFLDADQNVLAHGTVVAKTADALHVEYDTQHDFHRAPQKGDIAVRLGTSTGASGGGGNNP